MKIVCSIHFEICMRFKGLSRTLKNFVEERLNFCGGFLKFERWKSTLWGFDKAFWITFDVLEKGQCGSNR